MNVLKIDKNMLVSVFCALIPFFLFLTPGIRSYIIGTFYVAKIYNLIIISIYIVGCVLVFLSYAEIASCNKIIKQKNSKKNARLLGDANKIVFSSEHGLDDETVTALYESMKDSVNRKQSQRMAAVMSCANVSTMMGLLGTFAGLSMTIASVIKLLEASQIGHNTNNADTLGIIINVVSSLSEPLKGMNTAFVSSIYGVVSAMLLNVLNSLIRNSFVKLSVDLRDTYFDFLREVKQNKFTGGRIRNIRIETPIIDELVSDLKSELAVFHKKTLSMAEDKCQMMMTWMKKSDERHVLREEFEKNILSSINNYGDGIIQVKDSVNSTSQKIDNQQQVVQQIQNELIGQSKLVDLIHHGQTAFMQEQRDLIIVNEQQSDAISELQECSLQGFKTNFDQLNMANQSIVSVQSGIDDLCDFSKTEFSTLHTQLNKLGSRVIQVEKTNISRHQETQAIVESHQETFSPLLGEFAVMQQKLHKDVLLLKGKSDK